MLGSFSHTPRTLGLVWDSSPRSIVLVAGLTVAGAALPIGIAWVGKLIVDAVVAAVDDLVRAYPTAAAYAPGAIL